MSPMLLGLLTFWGTIGGLLTLSSGDGFVRGFLIFAVPPVVLAVAFVAYAFGIAYIIKRFGGDPSSEGVGIALYLSFAFLALPLAIAALKAFGVPLKW